MFESLKKVFKKGKARWTASRKSQAKPAAHYPGGFMRWMNKPAVQAAMELFYKRPEYTQVHTPPQRHWQERSKPWRAKKRRVHAHKQARTMRGVRNG